jgi:hypothetical protein
LILILITLPYIDIVFKDAQAEHKPKKMLGELDQKLNCLWLLLNLIASFQKMFFKNFTLWVFFYLFKKICKIMILFRILSLRRHFFTAYLAYVENLLPIIQHACKPDPNRHALDAYTVPDLTIWCGSDPDPQHC